MDYLFSNAGKISAGVDVAAPFSRLLVRFRCCLTLVVQQDAVVGFCEGEVSALWLFEAELSACVLVGGFWNGLEVVFLFEAERAVVSPRNFLLFLGFFPLDIFVAGRSSCRRINGTGRQRSRDGADRQNEARHKYHCHLYANE